MREKSQVAAIRSDFFSSPESRRFLSKTPIRAFFVQFAAHTAVFALLPFIALAVFPSLMDNLAVSTTLRLAIAFYLATRIRAIAIVMHDVCHDAFTDNSPKAETLGSLIAMVTGSPFLSYKTVHLAHHSFLGDPQLDKDICYDLIRPRRILNLFRFYFLPQFSEGSNEHRWATFARVGFWTVLGLAEYSVFGLAGIVYFLLLPLLVFYPIIRLICDWFDHGPLLNRPELGRSRNNTDKASLVMRHLFFSSNDEYHLLHHILPMIPSGHLPAAHRYLLRRSASYATLNGASINRSLR